jgi:hypothetical protein
MARFIIFSGEPRAVTLTKSPVGRGMQGAQSREREAIWGCAAKKWTGATLEMNPFAATLGSPQAGGGSGKPPLPRFKGSKASLA